MVAGRLINRRTGAGPPLSSLKTIHPLNKTPAVAIHVEQIFQIVSFLLVGIFFGASQIFGFLGTITTLPVIVLYVLANFALTIFVRREHPADFNIWRHAIWPVVGTFLLLPLLFVPLLPVPP